MTLPTTWTIGRGGLLGRHTERGFARAGATWRPTPPLTWGDPLARRRLADSVDAFAEFVAGRPWRIAWCAGAGIVASDESSLRVETALLGHLLDTLRVAVTSRRLADDGGLFFASSAGAVYAGSADPPFDERTDPRPLAPYGHAKLSQEALVADWADRTQVPAVIGRIANLYGPGQNLAKAQGLISQLCWTQIRQQPLTIYVPLSTMRDYVYAPDCGALIAAALRRPDEGTLLKVIASQRPMSVGLVLGEFRRVLRRNARLSARSSPHGRHQVLDLRLRSQVLRELDVAISTPFPVGLRATYDDVLSRFAVAS